MGSCPSEFESEAEVEQAAGEIVGHGVAGVGDVCDPIVSVHVADAGQVETVEAQPGIVEEATRAEEGPAAVAAFSAEEAVAETYVYALVGGRAEGVDRAVAVGRTEGKAGGESGTEGERPAGGAGEIVGEMEGEIEALVGGAGKPDAANLFFGLHEREGEPGVRAGDELAKELEIDACRIARGEVAPGVDDAHVVDGVGNEAGEGFVVDLRGELEGAADEAKRIVAAEDEVDGTLAFDVAVETDGGYAVGKGGVAEFFVERRLIVESRGEAERPSLAAGGEEAQRKAGGEEGFAVEVGVGKAHSKSNLSK